VQQRIVDSFTMDSRVVWQTWNLGGLIPALPSCKPSGYYPERFVRVGLTLGLLLDFNGSMSSLPSIPVVKFAWLE
jgi:hypothetical protein